MQNEINQNILHGDLANESKIGNSIKGDELHMKSSESIENLSKALSKFQSEVTNPLNIADNPYYKSRYAPLSEVLNTVRPLLAKNGLSIVQSPSSDGNMVTIKTLLLHDSGEWLILDPLSLKADKNTAQGAGSAITYGRRYSISAALGISSEDDDDGNYASGKAQPKTKSKTKQSTKKSSKLETIVQDIDKLAREKAKADQDAVVKSITKHHTNANYYSIEDVEVAKKVLEELKKL